MIFRNNLQIGEREYGTYANSVNRLNGAAESGVILIENYRGGVNFGGHIEPKLTVPYQVCETKIERQPHPRIIKPTWEEYRKIMDRFNNPFHVWTDDNISDEAFGSLFFYQWLKYHKVSEDRIIIGGEVDASGLADIYIVRAFEERRDRNEALRKLISEGKIPERFDDSSRYNELLGLVVG